MVDCRPRSPQARQIVSGSSTRDDLERAHLQISPRFRQPLRRHGRSGLGSSLLHAWIGRAAGTALPCHADGTRQQSRMKSSNRGDLRVIHSTPSEIGCPRQRFIQISGRLHASLRRSLRPPFMTPAHIARRRHTSHAAKPHLDDHVRVRANSAIAATSAIAAATGFGALQDGKEGNRRACAGAIGLFSRWRPQRRRVQRRRRGWRSGVLLRYRAQRPLSRRLARPGPWLARQVLGTWTREQNKRWFVALVVSDVAEGQRRVKISVPPGTCVLMFIAWCCFVAGADVWCHGRESGNQARA